MHNSRDSEALISVNVAAEVLGTSHMTVRRLIRRGELPAIRIGALIKIKHSDLTAFLENAKPA